MENKKYKVVGKTLSRVGLTQEMVDWLVAKGKTLNDSIAYHDPLLVQCVEELKPNGFYVATLEDNKYKILELANDSVIFTPKDIEILQKTWSEIPEEFAVVPEPAVEEKPEVPAEKPAKKAPAKKATTKKAATGEKKTTTRKKKTE